MTVEKPAFVFFIENASNGILKNKPLSKLPSPKSAAETSVKVAKAPTAKPLSNVLLTSKVAPLSFAKYLPICRAKS